MNKKFNVKINYEDGTSESTQYNTMLKAKTKFLKTIDFFDGSLEGYEGVHAESVVIEHSSYAPNIIAFYIFLYANRG